MSEKAPVKVPRHVGIIMDGNGRWAQAQGLPRLEGHRRGAENARKILDKADELGVEIVTLYAFSTENWARPSDEVSGIMALLELFLRNECAQMVKRQTRLKIIGERTRLPANIQKVIDETMAATQHFTRRTLVLALNYSSRDEVVRAVNQLIKEGKPADWNAIAAHLDTAGLPDPDLIIRSSGEMRLSNFMMLQAAYSELFFSPTPWPAFSTQEFETIIANFGQRERRFGKTSEQIKAEKI